MAVDYVRNRRLFKAEGISGALMLVCGVVGGLVGTWIEFLVAACGAGLLVISLILLRRYPAAAKRTAQPATSKFSMK